MYNVVFRFFFYFST
ncbi:pheST operon leader peptide PheM [Providencia heimbachae]|nr:pheST operon leader peptide PheM [Providencia sp.]NIH23015.1 pheST operon leader peptide PheM [Providencia heimbachae]